jgi:hypothetical protein
MKLVNTGYSAIDDNRGSERFALYVIPSSDWPNEYQIVYSDETETGHLGTWDEIDDIINENWGPAWDLEYNPQADEREGGPREVHTPSKRPRVYVENFGHADQVKIADMLLTYFTFLGDSEMEVSGADVVAALGELYTSLR